MAEAKSLGREGLLLKVEQNITVLQEVIYKHHARRALSGNIPQIINAGDNSHEPSEGALSGTIPATDCPSPQINHAGRYRV